MHIVIFIQSASLVYINKIKQVMLRPEGIAKTISQQLTFNETML